MSWNSPDKNPSNNPNQQNNTPPDPWRGGGNNSHEPGPPDLSEIVRRIQNALSNLLGGGPRNNTSRGTFKSVPPSGGSNVTPPAAGMGVLLQLVAGLVVVIYLLSGIYIVEPAERAAVFQFGKFLHTVGPGPHWLPLGIRSKQVINVDQIMTSRHSNRMLTQDENIVIVEMTVQYKVNNLEDYLFNVEDPIHSLQEATDSAIRQVIGESRLDDILTEKRAKIRDEIRQQIEEMLAIYKPGLVITDVAMQPAKAPDEVKDAFDDAIKAQEDEQRLVNKAQAYNEQVTRFAEGNAERILAEARAYDQEVRLRAASDVDRFNRLLPEYQAGKSVMRERLYLETVGAILARVHKIVVSDKGQNVMVLPLPAGAGGVGGAATQEIPVTSLADVLSRTQAASSSGGNAPAGDTRPGRVARD